MKQDQKIELFENIVRLRRAERRAPGDRDLAAVRISLEAQLGETVTPSFAARLLGVSHTTLRRWIERKDVAVVFDRDGRRMVPVSLLADLYEEVEAERASGRRHVLESVARRGRDRAGRIASGGLIDSAERSDQPARAAELRSLAYHREVARRLNRGMANAALALVRRWGQDEKIDPGYAREWEQLLEGPLPEVRKVLRADDQHARDLRQSSPFAGVLSEVERERIVSGIGAGSD